MDYTFSLCVNMFAGPGKINELGDILQNLGVKKVLMFVDNGVKSAGLTEVPLARIAGVNIGCAVFDKVEANPDEDLINSGLGFVRACAPQALVAIGGGSVIDFAKAVNILLSNPGPLSRYHGINLVKNPVLPLIAIPTLAGTASEVTAACVINDDKLKKKIVALGFNTSASIVVADPELTVNTPPDITAAAGVDALAHAIEAFMSANASPMTDAMAIAGLRLINGNLEKTVFDGENVSARSNMLTGSMLAGIAFSNTDAGMVHALSHALGLYCNLEHGPAAAAVLPYIMEYNLSAVPEKMKIMAEAMGLWVETLSDFEAGELAVKRVREICKNVKIPPLSQRGVTRDDFDAIAAAALEEDPGHTSPRPFDKDAVLDVLERAY